MDDNGDSNHFDVACTKSVKSPSPGEMTAPIDETDDSP